MPRIEARPANGASSPPAPGRRSPLPLEVTPEAFQIMLLDEIAGRLGEMQAKGVLYDKTVPITAALEEIYFPSPLISIDVFNDGPNMIFFNFNNSQVEMDGGLSNGETIGYNAQRPAFYRIRIRCAIDGETASVRLKGFA